MQKSIMGAYLSSMYLCFLLGDGRMELPKHVTESK
jgi:hypothetical protein